MFLLSFTTFFTPFHHFSYLLSEIFFLFTYLQIFFTSFHLLFYFFSEVFFTSLQRFFLLSLRIFFISFQIFFTSFHLFFTSLQGFFLLSCTHECIFVNHLDSMPKYRYCSVEMYTDYIHTDLAKHSES